MIGRRAAKPYSGAVGAVTICKVYDWFATLQECAARRTRNAADEAAQPRVTTTSQRFIVEERLGKASEMPAPTAAARPTRKVACASRVASAVKNCGASVPMTVVARYRRRTSAEPQEAETSTACGAD
jgi:hypothetical protein